MIRWRHIVGLGLLLTFAAANARASNPLALTSGSNGLVAGSLSWYGFTVTATCTESYNSGTMGGCGTVAGLNAIELLAVPSGKGTVTFEIVNATNNGSAILSSTTGPSVLNVALSFTAATTYKATSASTTTLGYAGFTCSTCSGLANPAVTSVAFSTGSTPGPLTDSLAVQKNATTASAIQVSGTALSTSFTAANSFNVTNTLTLNPSSKGVARLEFDALSLTLHTVPEPATATVLALGFGGLAMVRRRRSS
jgi:hypothetical protein